MSKLPRVAKIVLPILRGAGITSAGSPVTVQTWIPDIDYRTFPLLEVRRLGGTRSPRQPLLLGHPVIELTAYTKAPEGDMPQTEQLYEDALEALYEAQRRQTLTEFGHICFVKETLGATQFSSLYQDSWRVQGLIQLGIRPPRST